MARAASGGQALVDAHKVHWIALLYNPEPLFARRRNSLQKLVRADMALEGTGIVHLAHQFAHAVYQRIAFVLQGVAEKEVPQRLDVGQHLCAWVQGAVIER